MTIRRIKLWDLPTRIFHWSLFALVSAALVSGEIGGNAIEWHGKFGLAIVGLVVFRLVWGFVGSTYARFAQFFPSPASIAAYLRGQWHGLGHNPVGALSAFALLALVLAQALGGLFSNDDIAFRGPLFDLVGKDLSDTISGLHSLAGNVLIAFIALHVAAIIFYKRVKKNNLVLPMITGWKDVPEGAGESAKGGGVVAFVVALAIALAAVYAASGALLPPPPPAPAVTAPAAPSW
ncbi:cytochrome B [Rhodocyclus tenuis]|uniref:Cytochrome B n=2 Tax=Rhodocyclus TaxID=1064 RepID=A0A6L5JT41_RHOTE|nr:cytochrome b/b6 domain-containing protein [Rhodocyclus gracilis]MQY50577.1 cytochrome B [Rhodocyclus gracilis]MRD72580.1 cytochrome B [Rhodocyclus gracilis]NJA88106.1 cytochrome B [Rhodocyclus gracilis]